ncbi:MAG: Uma2 family endonuclease [Clostridia bacterium]|nr:Uma2 family endonuclease [Clostridia bacterium]
MKEEEKNNMENLAYNIKKYTYQDLLEMNDGKRYEIINGVLYEMSSPSVNHQDIVGELYVQLHNYLKGEKCKVFISPLDVCLSGAKEPKKEYNIVEPDIIVVCDEKKITDKCIMGAPDMVIEVVSKYSRKHDTFIKFNLYQNYGVKEYWIIDAEAETISQYILNEKNMYTLQKIYEITEEVKVNVLKNCTISLK